MISKMDIMNNNETQKDPTPKVSLTQIRNVLFEVDYFSFKTLMKKKFVKIAVIRYPFSDIIFAMHYFPVK